MKKILSWMFLLIFMLTMFGAGGCQNMAKKPNLPSKQTSPLPKPQSQVRLAPEVTKYKQEPTISLYRTATGAKQQIKLENYIKGVVAAEIGPKFPMEALKAQAIVARTMTLALLEYESGTRAKHGTDASDNHTEFQAYDEKLITDNISKAVDATRGQVLTYNGKFVYAEFHSVSKDKTATVAEGFPKLQPKASAYLLSVPTNGLKYAPAKYRNWTVTVPKSKIISIMGPKAGDLSDIKVSKRGPSGRAVTISAGSASIPAVDLREKVGFDKLFSTVISGISLKGNNVIFKGSGWGHGVGMEQWGAYTMAKENKKAKEIVEHYYKGTTWTQLYK